MDRALRTRPVLQAVPGRTSRAAATTLASIERTSLRQSVARALVLPVRLVAAAIALIAAAAAGFVYVVLLPICGVASVAEGAARGSWRAARAVLRTAARGTLPQD